MLLSTFEEENSILNFLGLMWFAVICSVTLARHGYRQFISTISSNAKAMTDVYLLTCGIGIRYR